MIDKILIFILFSLLINNCRTFQYQNNNQNQNDQNNHENSVSNSNYKIGFGIGDITGPAAEINMMGYAKLGQDSQGIHTRLYARTLIMVDQNGSRICYVNVDLCASAQLIKILVIQELQSLFGSLYTHENVLISATHTHSGPGGYFQYLLYIITQEGFIKPSLDAIVTGVVKSIKDAHYRLQPGKVYYTEGTLSDASINRSPASYLLNPHEERIKYKDDTDKTFQLLKFTNLNDEPIGMVNWFAVHGVSMNNTNKLISSDNKGYAAITFEKDFNGYTNVGKGPFVAIFGQANEGDSSPNTEGAVCTNSGEPCDFIHSTCEGKNEYCVAFGPGKDMFESTKIIGEKQYEKAKELFQNATEEIKGPIKHVYQNINMAKRLVTLEDGSEIHTCAAALGFSFAAGTTDGEGANFFEQGTIDGHENKFFDYIRDFLKHPSDELVECQKPKAILLPVGELDFPYQWTPEIMPTQILQIGNIVIVGLPGEFTTMSGRRIRNDVKKIFADHGKDVHVILAGLSNSYANYIATPEEYQLQRYEGGSTMFGPHTLDAYREQFKYLSKQLVSGESVDVGPSFPNLLDKEITLKPGVVFDTPLKSSFGAVVEQPKERYYTGQRVEVKFSAANPRNDMRLEGTFLTVERCITQDNYEIVATDANWETIFIWNRDNLILGTSDVRIIWDIPMDTKPGHYRIRYFGNNKNILGIINEFVGTTNEFEVISLPSDWMKAFQIV